jgi:energy-coupling factor transporter ATP-binding protein EcfA2
MIIGIAGKIGSGKSTLANYLAFRLRNYYPEVVGFSYALKGLNIANNGLLSFFPQKAISARLNLQNLGNRGRKIDPEIWIKTIKAFETPNCLIINDVRFKNEADWIREKYGITLYLMPLDQPPAAQNLPDFVINDVSEQFDPNWADKVILYENLDEMKQKALEYITRHYSLLDINSTPTIYVGLNISNRKNWRTFYETKISYLRGMFEVVSALDANENNLVEDCLSLTSSKYVDGGLFYLSAPSIGATVEILNLALLQKPVAVVAEHKDLMQNQFLNFFAKVFNDEKSAIDYLLSHFKP